jgi:O-antigen/teichoic acid export membrane protein
MTKVFDGILSLIAIFFISKYMAPDSYGIIMFAMGFVGLFTIISNLGVGHAHIKKISEGKDLGTCNGTYFLIKFILTGILIIITILSIYIWTSVLNRGFETQLHIPVIFIMLMFHVFASIGDIFASTFIAKKEVASTRIPGSLSIIIRVILVILIAFNQLGVIILAIAYLSEKIVYTILTLVIFIKKKNPISRPTREYFKEYYTYAFPLIFVVVASTIMINIDKVIIQLFWGAADVGFYAAAFGLSSFILFFAASVETLLIPTYSSLHANNRIKEITNITHRSERYISMMIFPAIVGLMILAEPVSEILLNGWMGAVPILQILPIFVLLSSLERPYQSQFLGMNHPKLARNRILIMILINIPLNILLIPQDIKSIGLKGAGLGAQGAAIATVIAYGIGLIYSRYISYKITKSRMNPRIILHAFASVIMSGCIYVLINYVGLVIARWYHLLFISLIGLGIYSIILIIIGEFKKHDLIFLLDTLNIIKMYHYIKEEIFGK